MRKVLFVLLLTLAGAFALAKEIAPKCAKEGVMAYCALEDLQGSYSADSVAAWSRFNPDTIDRAIADAGAEIDGYLLSGGYAVPLAGPPANIKKYCVDIAAANLLIGYGIIKDDDGSNAILEQAKAARRYLSKVAEGKFRIPGYTTGDEVAKPPSGGVRVLSRPRLDLRGF